MGVVTRLVAAYGAEAVAGFGVASRIEFFALTVVRSLSAVLMPFIGQNWGAGRHDRVGTGVSYSNRFSLAWGALMFGVLALGAASIARIFNDDPSVISTTALYLRIVPTGYGVYGVIILAAAALNVLHRPIHAASLSIAHMFVLYIPLALVGSHFFGLRGMFTGLALSFFLAGIAAHLLLKTTLASVANPRTLRPTRRT
jgi:Na+-driven multidrug efflux pump